jgi:hypothetical protein
MEGNASLRRRAVAKGENMASKGEWRGFSVKIMVRREKF